MLEIRSAVRNDVDLLRTLIHEMGEMVVSPLNFYLGDSSREN